MIVLGIETSCDETAAAVVAASSSGTEIRSNVIQAQLVEHAPYGGVVPEIAARAHLQYLDAVVMRALAEAGVSMRRGSLGPSASRLSPSTISKPMH